MAKIIGVCSGKEVVDRLPRQSVGILTATREAWATEVGSIGHREGHMPLAPLPSRGVYYANTSAQRNE